MTGICLLPARMLIVIIHIIQELVFQCIEGQRKIYVYLVGIHQAACLRPEGFQLFPAVLLNIHHLGRLVDTLAVLEYGNQNFPHGIGVRIQIRLFPGIYGIEEHERLISGICLISQGDEIGDDLVVLFTVNSVYRFITGVGDLFRIF